MTLIHVGVRPAHKTYESLKDERPKEGIRYEKLPQGGYKIWTQRMLQSGCNQELSGDKRLGDLIYCPHCDEFFSADQFIKQELQDEGQE